ncbi:hypothetical protein PT276_04255 [Orbaceae bacterium ESL0721]|nr:hypothetical protein [Orbaceae bacterium ESL0721]
MDSKIIWETIDHFNSYNEYEEFYNFLCTQTFNGLIEQVPVTKYYAGENLDEYWFKNSKGSIWRLVAPDFPFKGYWGPVC